jgi:carbamoyltransferase
VTEDIVLAISRHIHQETKLKHLVLAGGVALNCVANGRLLREGPFEDIWVQPASGDAGGALGAATFVWHHLLEQPRKTAHFDSQKGSLLGPKFAPNEIRNFLKQHDITFTELSNERDLLHEVAGQLEQEKVVGWFQGRMEYGPRALGSRSIIGDPRSPKMQSIMNLKIKYRESFRPFAPIVVREKASEWFDIAPEHESPYMLIVADVLPEHQTQLNEIQRQTMDQSADLCERVNVPRSTVPAITHVDYSARLQTVDSTRNPRLHALLEEFHRKTGCPILVNTSFNVRGEPIVCTPQDAYRCFNATEMDVLVLDNFVIEKARNRNDLSDEKKRQHLEAFALD